MLKLSLLKIRLLKKWRFLLHTNKLIRLINILKLLLIYLLLLRLHVIIRPLETDLFGIK